MSSGEGGRPPRTSRRYSGISSSDEGVPWAINRTPVTCPYHGPTLNRFSVLGSRFWVRFEVLGSAEPRTQQRTEGSAEPGTQHRTEGSAEPGTQHRTENREPRTQNRS